MPTAAPVGSWTSLRSRRARRARRRWRNTLDLAQPDGLVSATTDTGWPSTTVGRCWPAPSPEALIGPIASATERIRVGSGGVMLPHYSPLEGGRDVHALLAGLFPGRIDLGLWLFAAGTDPMTTFALQRDRG